MPSFSSTAKTTRRQGAWLSALQRGEYGELKHRNCKSPPSVGSTDGSLSAYLHDAITSASYGFDRNADLMSILSILTLATEIIAFSVVYML